jgi:hypothetical protein
MPQEQSSRKKCAKRFRSTLLNLIRAILVICPDCSKCLLAQKKYKKVSSETMRYWYGSLKPYRNLINVEMSKSTLVKRNNLEVLIRKRLPILEDFALYQKLQDNIFNNPISKDNLIQYLEKIWIYLEEFQTYSSPTLSSATIKPNIIIEPIKIEIKKVEPVELKRLEIKNEQKEDVKIIPIAPPMIPKISVPMTPSKPQAPDFSKITQLEIERLCSALPTSVLRVILLKCNEKPSMETNKEDMQKRANELLSEIPELAQQELLTVLSPLIEQNAELLVAVQHYMYLLKEPQPLSEASSKST